MAKRIVLHIGASKCGSSALQTALTENPVLEASTGRVAYAAISAKGKLSFGEKLKPSRARGYCASANAPDLLKLPSDVISQIVRELRGIDAHTIILSQEGWLAQAGRMKSILGEMAVRVSAIVYVRPPVTLMNSGWWQWGCWEGVPLDVWVKNRLPQTRWVNHIKDWKSIPEVDAVTVRLLSNDIVEDFASLLGFDPGGLSRQSNSGLPAVILRLYQRNRQLRPDRNASEMDSILSRHLTINGSPPWVLDRSLVEWVIEETRAASLELLDILDSASSQAMRDDARWWDAGAFAKRNVEPWQPQPIDADDLERLAVDLIEALAKPYRPQ